MKEKAIKKAKSMLKGWEDYQRLVKLVLTLLPQQLFLLLNLLLCLQSRPPLNLKCKISFSCPRAEFEMICNNCQCRAQYCGALWQKTSNSDPEMCRALSSNDTCTHGGLMWVYCDISSLRNIILSILSKRKLEYTTQRDIQLSCCIKCTSIKLIRTFLLSASLWG